MSPSVDGDVVLSFETFAAFRANVHRFRVVHCSHMSAKCAFGTEDVIALQAPVFVVVLKQMVLVRYFHSEIFFA